MELKRVVVTGLGALHDEEMYSGILGGLSTGKAGALHHYLILKV
jgi:hypothetical protein